MQRNLHLPWCCALVLSAHTQQRWRFPFLRFQPGGLPLSIAKEKQRGSKKPEEEQKQRSLPAMAAAAATTFATAWCLRRAASHAFALSQSHVLRTNNANFSFQRTLCTPPLSVSTPSGHLLFFFFSSGMCNSVNAVLDTHYVQLCKNVIF